MFKWIFLIFFCAASLVSHASQSRRILALWDSNDHETTDYTESYIHQKLEMVFNHYGLLLDYVDIHTLSPNKFSPQNLKQYRGMILWSLDSASQNPTRLFTFLTKWQQLNLPTIVIGDVPLFENNNGRPYKWSSIQKLYNNWGLQPSKSQFENPLLINILSKDFKKKYEFERPLENEFSPVRKNTILTAKLKSWLSYVHKKSGQRADVIIKGKNVFIAPHSYTIFTNPLDYTTQWRINPFEIISELFQTADELIADTTTLNGNRIWYSHIDGDAFISLSQVDRESLCGKIIREKIMEKYQLPISASLVTSEVDPNYLGNERYFVEVKKMMELPYIEPASHTFSHPLSWDMNPSKADVELYIKDKRTYTGGPIVAYKLIDYKMNYQQEIIGSMKFINDILPENKKSNMVFWSGNCRPPLEVFKLLEENNFYNINGGDSRFDRRYPSYSHVFPIYRQIGKYIQIYSSNSNENTYTNLWEGPYSGFQEVIETFKNTEKPIRIKPINIYYHYYSGEKISSLKALTKVYDWTISQEIAPIFTSEFVKIANDFIKAKSKKINKNTYVISQNGDLKTFRIDRPGLEVNYDKSKNIIGHRTINSSTYFFLGNKSESKLTIGKTKSFFPYLVNSNGFVDKFHFNAKDKVLSLKLNSHVKNTLTLYTGKYKITGYQDGITVEYFKNHARLTINQKSYQGQLRFIQ
jgi:hypothetical protein